MSEAGVICETVTFSEGYPGPPGAFLPPLRETYIPSAQGLSACQRRKLRRAGWYYRIRRDASGKLIRGWFK